MGGEGQDGAASRVLEGESERDGFEDATAHRLPQG